MFSESETLRWFLLLEYHTPTKLPHTHFVTTPIPRLPVSQSIPAEVPVSQSIPTEVPVSQSILAEVPILSSESTTSGCMLVF